MQPSFRARSLYSFVCLPLRFLLARLFPYPPAPAPQFPSSPAPQLPCSPAPQLPSSPVRLLPSSPARLFTSRLSLLAGSLALLTGCGVYSFTGASIQGKTVYIRVLENRARNLVPTLSASLTDKIRSRILSQTGLAPVKTESADYDVSGAITAYEVTVTGVQNTQQAAQNRLTITLQISFENRLDEKASFQQAFTRFADFPASQTIQAVEARLIEEIGTELADDIFNKAFVNW